MEKEILDDNYFEPDDEYQDDIDIVDRWAGMFGEGLLIGIFALIISQLAEFTKIYGKTDEGFLHQNILILLFFVVLNKDFLHGQSIVKHYYGYLIIDVKTRKPASAIQCVIRNFTLYFNWIIVAVAMVFPKRRLGDLLAGTKLMRVEKEESTKVYFSKMTKYKWDFNFWFSIIVAVFFSWVTVGGGYYFLGNVFR